MSDVIVIYPYIETNPYERLLAEALERRGCKVLRLPVIRSRFPFEIVSQCSGASVVHFHWIEHLYNARTRSMLLVRTFVFLVMLVALRARGTRIVYTMHNLLPHNTKRPRFHMLVQWLILRLANATIVHSQAALDAGRKTFGRGCKYEIIPHGRYDGFYPSLVSQAQARASLGIPIEARVALFFGGMGGYKGIRSLLESLEDLSRRKILVVLAGDTSELGKSDRELLKQASKWNVVVHEGFVPESKVQYFMKAANCLVLPYSTSFTSGMAFLGLSFRLPIVGTHATAFKEMRDLKLCLPCDPDSPKSVADAIAMVCSWDRVEFDERCESFLATCGWDGIAMKHLAVYGVGPSESRSVMVEEAVAGASRPGDR
jgi:beta-1,4-mannosyltransferase